MTPRDDDEKDTDRPDPATGETDLGADWLLSQLDDTGAYSTIDDETSPPATQEEGRRSLRRRFRRRQREEAGRQESADAETEKPVESARPVSGTAGTGTAGTESVGIEETDAEGAGTGVPRAASPESLPARTEPAPAEGAGSVPPVTRKSKATPEQSHDADDGAPTQAFDVMADRAASDPKPPPSAKNDGGFSWGLTPNDDPDPLVVAAERQSTAPDSEPSSADDVAEPQVHDEATPTTAFDPFADHEPEAISPEQAALDAAFAAPGAYDRLYDEATLAALDSDGDDASEDADDEDAADDATAAGIPVPKSAASAPALDEPLLPEKAEFPDDAERAEAEALADEVGVPLEETTESPDLGILDLFGGSKRSDREPAGQEQKPNASTSGSSATGDETETSARLRALFESTATAPAATQPPAAASRSERSAPPAPPDAPARSDSGSRNSRPMLLVGLAVVAVLVLGGLFWVGTLIPGMVSASQPQPSETSTPTPTVSIPAEGTLPPGTYAWDMLRGGECLGDYDSPWAEEFTVVDCEGEHDAQLVSVGTMSDDENAAFPGEDELASQIYLKCSDPSVIDLTAAGEYGDVQVQGSYPVTEEQWNEGERNYYCFVNRSSGDPLTGSLVPAEG